MRTIDIEGFRRYNSCVITVRMGSTVDVSSCAVRLSLAENVKRFVEIVTRYALETDVCGGRYVVDGASLPGILSLDLSKNLDVVIYGGDCQDMLRELSPFIVG